MRRAIRKRIRSKTEGLDLAADLNAEIAINVGGSQVTTRQSDRRPQQAGGPETGHRAERPGRRDESMASDQEASER